MYKFSKITLILLILFELFLSIAQTIYLNMHKLDDEDMISEN
jgi:hypothetical protein